MHDLYPYTADSTVFDEKSIVFLRPDQIRVPSALRNAPKTPNSIIRLAQSVKKYGILEPLTVRPMVHISEGSPVLYRLIEGEHCFRAAILAGIERIPCLIAPENGNEKEICSLLEHAKDASTDFFEQARAFRTLATAFSLTQEEIARRSGLSQSAIANKLRLLHFSYEEQQQIRTARLSERHARAILRLSDAQERMRAIRYIHAEGLNVAATEHLVEEMQEKSAPRHLRVQQGTPPIAHAPKNRSENGVFSAPIPLPQRQPSGPRPQKLALADLTPLYNSIERVLSIFRKTGATATCSTEEGEGSARITIRITRDPQ